MKRIITYLFIICASTFITPHKSYAQQPKFQSDSVYRLIDTVLHFARSKSFYSGQVNWRKVEDSVRYTAINANSIKEAIPAIQLLFDMLGDHHGFITYGGTSYGWTKPRLPLDKSTHQNLLKKYHDGYKLTAKVIDKNYGYLLIPNNNPTHPGDFEHIGQQIRDSLALFNNRKFKGVIIDLRLNPGGSMWPMIGGLAALLEPGKLGSFVFPSTKTEETWGIKNNKVYDSPDITYIIRSRGENLYRLKVVVLIGPYTCSSGEALAISFKGRPNTLFIGEATGGYTTANESLQFTSQVGVFFSTAAEADRTGKIYPDKVEPDEEIIGGDDFDHLLNDKKVNAALRWFKNNSLSKN